jgi:hypothetical protein
LKTFELSTSSLNPKAISLLISIFVGQEFVYSFFNLDDMSRDLSFSLDFKFSILIECTFALVIFSITWNLFIKI